MNLDDVWLYNGKEFTENMIDDNFGMVYCITNITNGKRYIGKKSFSKTKTYQKNKKKKRKRVASDWLSYTGSNDLLNEDIKSGHQIKKEILHLCKSKGLCSYYETKEIFDRSCLLNNDHYYNMWVYVRINRSHLVQSKLK